MTEGTDGPGVNPFQEKLKSELREGENWVTNAPKKSKFMVGTTTSDGSTKFEPERTAAQTAFDMQASGQYESVRVLPTAFDKHGKPLADMSAVVVKKKQQG